VHDPDSVRADAVALAEHPRRVPGDRDDAIRDRERAPLDERRGRARAGRARAVELGGVHVRDEGPIRRLLRRQPGREREPVVRVDDVEASSRRDLAGGGRVALDGLDEVGSVQDAAAAGPRGAARRERVHRRVRVDALRGGGERGAACAVSTAPTTGERRDDLERADAAPATHPTRRTRGGRGQHEDDVDASLPQPANQSRAGDGETAGDAGRVFPPQHENPHGGG